MVSKHKRAGKGKPDKGSVTQEVLPPKAQREQLAFLFNAGRHAELESFAQQLIASYPRSGFVWMLLGLSLHVQGKDGVSALRKAAALSPDDAEIHNNLGNTLWERGQYEAAEASCRQAVRIAPEFAVAHNNLGNALRAQGRLDEALACFRRAVAIMPDYAAAHANLGNTLRDLGQNEAAMVSCQRALEIAPDFPLAYLCLGCALQDTKQFAEAERVYRRALEFKPDFAEAYNNLAAVMRALGRLDEAAASARRALECQPDFADAACNLGLVLWDLEQLEEAEKYYRRALALKPDLPMAWNNLGTLQLDLGLLDEAIASYCRTLVQAPDYADGYGNLLFAMNYHPDKSAEEIFSAYREYDARFGLPHRKGWRDHGNPRIPGKRLKVGYVSPDFRHHSCRYFVEPLLSHHNKREVEVTAYAELVGEDEVTRRYKGYADHWVVTSGLTDDALAERIRADGIDILVDLAGHTDKNRLGVFARKPAPVQASWLGYGYTTGLTAIDYLMTDSASAPEGSEGLFSEQPWRLETPCYAYRPAEGIGEPGPLPAMRKGHVTYGTLTRAIRLNHRVIRAWSEILQRVPGSRLLVDSRNYHESGAQENLKAKFAVHGIAPQRLEIGYHSPPWDILREIDIGLDCFPHNSGTTLFETLYMGMPFVTLAGRPSVGRLGSSVLHGIGHPEWITESEAEYIEKAVALAGDLERLSGLRRSLRAEMARSALMDEAGFARRVEAAYRQMWEKWCATGKPAESDKPAKPNPRTADRLPQSDREQLIALYSAGRFADLENLSRKLLENYPDSGIVWKVLAFALQSQGKEALDSLRKAEALLPEDADIRNNLGNALREAGRLEEAMASYQRALALKPDYAEAYYNLGNALEDLGRYGEAAESHQRALGIKPDFMGAHFNLGNNLQKLGDYDGAVASYRQVLKLDPSFAQGWNNLGTTLQSLGQLDEAIVSCRHALEIDPAYSYAYSNLLFALNYHPDKSAEEIYAAYREYDVRFGLPHRQHWKTHDNLKDAGKRLRVGYVSPDFRLHSCRNFLEPLLAHHDKREVEVTAYAELSVEDSVTQRYKGYVDHWVVTTGLSDDALSARIRADSIDILIDLAGHTSNNRLVVFAHKPAPVQASWLGYNYTTGLAAIDYLLTDAASVPAGSEPLFSETPWRLETPWYAYRPAEGMGEPGPLPAQRKGRITFGTLTRAIRLNHRVIRVWSEILKRVPEAHLVIDSNNYQEAAMQERLRARFGEHGIAPQRLEIGYHSPPWDIFREIDIGLDCFPHNSGTTLFETLYMGIPFVTLAGRPSVGRLGSSILHGLGRLEWIAESEEEYIEKAVALAGDLEKLDGLRHGLRAEMALSVLMDEAGFTRRLETAYRQMWEKWCGDSQSQDEAGQSCLSATTNNGSDFFGDHYNLGNELEEQGRLEDAAESYRHSLALNPDFVDAHNNLGYVLAKMGQPEAALESYRSALAINPDYAIALANLGNLLKNLGRFDEAVGCYRRALVLNPEFCHLYSNLLFALNYYPEKYEQEIQATCLKFDKHFNRWNGEAHPNERNPKRRLRIGYVSPDFRRHAVSFFIEPILAHHDRAQVEIYCYAEVKREDDYTERLRGLADYWFTTVGCSDEAVEQMIREHRIDILVDLAGHSADNRLPVFARKPAPVQITYLGFAGTTGLTAMDYRLCDRYVDPEGEADKYYTEKLLRLPDSLWCYRPRADMPEVGPLPALQRGYLTFGSFNNFNKIDQETLNIWAALLKALPDARLLMLTVPDGNARQQLLRQFAEREIAANRLELHANLPVAEFHHQFLEVDVALDPVNINGGTTTCEALWMGVPVISLTGRRFLSRAGLSLLTTAGMADFAVATAEEYIRLAVHLAANLPLLAEIRAGLRAHVAASPLADEAAFTRHLEAAFRGAWAEWCSAVDGTVSAEAACSIARQETAEERSRLFRLFDAGQYGEMESLARRLIGCYPESGLAWKALSVSLQTQGKEATAELLRATERLPEDADVHNNLGNSLRSAGQFDAAQASYRRALEINPDFADAHYNLGNTLQDIGLLQEAQASYRRSLELNPDFAEAHNNLGNVLKRIGQLDEAIACFQRASALKPDSPEMYNSLGNALLDSGYPDGALENYRRALALKPDYAEAHSNLLFALNYHPGKSDEEILAASKEYDARFGLPLRADWQPHRNIRDTQRRLKVGFVSPDFRCHAVAYFTEPILANRDRSQLEIYCYAEVKREDDYTARFKRLADHWYSTVGQSDEAMAQMIREHGIDILVDLAGHSAGNRLRVFARKPAPVQVTYLGYPATTGLSAMDYRITDYHADPEGGSESRYVERLVRLPDSLWCYRPAAGMPEVSLLPALARGYLTFGSFNNANKIDLATLDLWAELLRTLPGARLALFAVPEGSLRERLLQAFGERGVAAERLEIHGVMPPAAFHHAYLDVDIALDPVNINGGTTTCEALWMGVPVISLTGRRFLSRAGLSLLTTAGMADFAVATAEEYIRLAVHLAANLPLLAEIRAGLRARIAASPLTDEAVFTRHLEVAFRRMWEKWCSASGDAAATEAACSIARQETAEERSQLFGLFNAGQYGEMENLARRLINYYPESGVIWKGLSVALQAQGKEAMTELQRTVTLLPEDADARNNLGNALRKAGQFEAAQASYRRALEINPDFADAHNNLGNVFKDLGRLDEAVASYRHALAARRDFAEAHNNLGNALKDLKQFDVALDSYRHALAIKPDFAAAYNNLGDALTCMGRLDEAQVNCRRALELTPDDAAAHYNLGNALREAGQFDEALSSYGKALEIRPDYADAYTNRGNILKDIGRLDEAAASYHRALEINPRFAEAHNNLGNVLQDLGHADEAMASYRRALKFNPAFAEVYSNLLFSLNSYPALHDEEIFSVSREYDRRFMVWDGARHPNDGAPERRLRIGYVSPDFRRHAVAYFAEPILARHDRTQVEIYCYAEVRREDDYTERFRRLSDHWYNTAGLSDEAVERLIRTHRIDILIDLAGHTRNNRLPVFGRKPAPVQITYLGYAGSTGLSTVDYRLTDRYADPEGEAESRYTEKLLRLPDSLWCYRPSPDMPEVTALPALDRGYLTFGSFNGFNKIDRDTRVLWAALLRQIPDSRLVVLTVPEGEARQRLLREFASLGVEAGRLDLRGPMPTAAFHRQFLEADIALDPVNVNGGTTTCEALWMGLPVISLTGKRFLSRAGLSLLSTLGMPDFAVASNEDYLRVATYLDGNRELLADLRAGLRGHVAGSMLTDEVSFVRNLENLYREVWCKWCGSHDRNEK